MTKLCGLKVVKKSLFFTSEDIYPFSFPSLMMVMPEGRLHSKHIGQLHQALPLLFKTLEYRRITARSDCPCRMRHQPRHAKLNCPAQAAMGLLARRQLTGTRGNGRRWVLPLDNSEPYTINVHLLQFL